MDVFTIKRSKMPFRVIPKPYIPFRTKIVKYTDILLITNFLSETTLNPTKLSAKKLQVSSHLLLPYLSNVSLS